MDVTYLYALAEPTRFRIVELLRERPLAVNEIAEALDLRQPQASKHLRYLAKSGIVTMRPAAQQRIYTLRAEPFINLGEWAHSFERQWQDKLNNLDKYLDTMKKGESYDSN